MKRMDREEFFGKLAPLDKERLRKALWNLYWRGSAAMRERIEAELDPEAQVRRQRTANRVVNPDSALREAQEFVALARSGAYIAGDRRVSRQERSRWRFTFQRLVADARDALLSPEGVPIGAAAVEQLIDLAHEAKDHDYFHSEDPVEAARFVVSDAVALLWSRLIGEYGFARFAERAAPQTAALSEWHDMLFGKLVGYGAKDGLDRLIRHAALGGPELTFLQARLAHQRGDVDGARHLVHQSLEKRPGHEGFLDFAREIGAPLPPSR